MFKTTEAGLQPVACKNGELTHLQVMTEAAGGAAGALQVLHI